MLNLAGRSPATIRSTMLGAKKAKYTMRVTSARATSCSSAIDTMLLGPVVVFGFCLMAALYPALRLFRLRPVEAMRVA